MTSSLEKMDLHLSMGKKKPDDQAWEDPFELTSSS
jgi:hypothetical protein